LTSVPDVVGPLRVLVMHVGSNVIGRAERRKSSANPMEMLQGSMPSTRGDTPDLGDRTRRRQDRREQ